MCLILQNKSLWTDINITNIIYFCNYTADSSDSSEWLMFLLCSAWHCTVLVIFSLTLHSLKWACIRSIIWIVTCIMSSQYYCITYFKTNHRYDYILRHEHNDTHTTGNILKAFFLSYFITKGFSVKISQHWFRWWLGLNSWQAIWKPMTKVYNTAWVMH